MHALRHKWLVACLISWMVCLPLQGASGVVDVVIRDYTFEPATLEIRVGTTVRWTNQEKRASHSIFFTGPGSTESERLFPGDSWQRHFDQVGTYLYRCGPHPEMSGKVVVTD